MSAGDFTVAVDASTGLLTLVRALDRETLPGFSVNIAATDQGMGNNQATVCGTILMQPSANLVLPPLGCRENYCS